MNIELSENNLLAIRITALELMYRDTYKTINFANKILLEVELGKAYNELTKLKEIEQHEISKKERNTICNKQTRKHSLGSSQPKHKQNYKQTTGIAVAT